MICKYPANFARFYDTIYHHVRDSTDHEYFMKEILNTSGKVLEAGVGTGRLFSDALDRGSDIYGLDISESMIGILPSKLTEEQHYRISLQNITDFSYHFKFDLVIAPFRVFMHQVERSLFEKYNIIGDYHGKPLNSESKDFIAICQKQ